MCVRTWLGITARRQSQRPRNPVARPKAGRNHKVPRRVGEYLKGMTTKPANRNQRSPTPPLDQRNATAARTTLRSGDIPNTKFRRHSEHLGDLSGYLVANNGVVTAERRPDAGPRENGGRDHHRKTSRTTTTQPRRQPRSALAGQPSNPVASSEAPGRSAKQRLAGQPSSHKQAGQPGSDWRVAVGTRGLPRSAR
jgi:hypothetical protein